MATIVGPGGAVGATTPVAPGGTPGSSTPPPGDTERVGAPTGTPVSDPLSGDQRDAYEAVLAILTAAGLEALAPVILGYAQQSYNQDTIMLLIQDTPEYKTRFAGNEERKKAGIPVLSPGEYLATENSYRQALMLAGLPPGFYDSYTDFQKWIGGDTSPTEVQKRIDMASQEMYAKGDAWRQQMRTYYPELTDGDLVSYFIDAPKALPLLEQQWRRTDIGAAAARAGINVSLDRASQLDLSGVSADQALQGYQQVAGMTDALSRLGNVYGDQYAQTDAENEVFGLTGSADAARKRKRLASQERASFGGSGGVGQKGLTASNQQ